MGMGSSKQNESINKGSPAKLHTNQAHDYNFQNIQFLTLSCNYVTHYPEQIRGLCLRLECNQSCTVCFMCTQDLHKDCSTSITFLKDIPKLLMPFQHIQSQAIEYSNKQTQELIYQIQLILAPINEYFDNPNLCNLNQLGMFLRKAGKFEIELNILLEKCKQQTNLKEQIKHTTVQNINSQSIQTLMNKGFVLDAQKKYEEAFNCYEQAFKINPKYATAWNNKGIVLYEQKKYEEAINCYEQALKIDPKYATAWNNKGIVLYEQKKYEEAINCYEQALKIDPKYATAWNNKGIMHNIFLGNVLYEQKKYEEAINCYEQALKIDPKYATAWNNKGNVLYKQKKYEEAINCYEQALKIDPKYATAWNNKGFVLYEQKKYEEAINCYEQALKIDPKNATAWNNKGNVLSEQKKYVEAAYCWEQAIHLDPQHCQVLNNQNIIDLE